MKERECLECGTLFKANTGRKTCSRRCASTRQRRSVRQLQEKSGDFYNNWQRGIKSQLKPKREVTYYGKREARRGE